MVTQQPLRIRFIVTVSTPPPGWAVPFNFYQSLGQGTNVFPSHVKKFFRKRCKTSDAYYGHLSIPVTSYIG